MSDLNDEEDFELEFSDLPPDEHPSASGQLVKHGLRLLSKIRPLADKLTVGGTRLLAATRVRLLANMAFDKSTRRGDYTDAADEGDFALEISDLPPVEHGRLAETIIAWSWSTWTRRAPKVQLGRFMLAACTVCMVLFLVLASFPFPHNWLYRLAVSPSPTPTEASTDVVSVSQSEIIITSDGKLWHLSSGTTTSDSPPIVIPITPGPMPLHVTCPSPPIQDTSSPVGANPVWLTGFSGPYARAYLSASIPVPTFPSLYGFPVPLQIEIPANYHGHITLEGKAMSNNLDIAFGYNPFGDQFSSFTLDPQSRDNPPYTILVNGAKRLAWNITLFLPAADCYSLKASWAGGHWFTNFLAFQSP